MTPKEKNAQTVLDVIEDLFKGKRELSHMTGDMELCGKTADDVLRQIKEDERKGGTDDENRD